MMKKKMQSLDVIEKEVASFFKRLKPYPRFYTESDEELVKLSLNLLNILKLEFGLANYFDTFITPDGLPFVFVTSLKWYMPHREYYLRLTSSGTSGQKTENYWNRESLYRIDFVVRKTAEELGMVSSTPTVYFIFGYDPKEVGDLGTAWSDENLKQLAPELESFYLIRNDKLCWDEFISEFYRVVADGVPVRLIGFPALLWEFLVRIESVSLNPESLILTGGGWKKRESEAVTEFEFVEKCKEKLGVERVRIRDVYGFTEHGLPYFTCEYGNHHLHGYSKIFVRDLQTLKVLDYGQPGLMHVVSPYNTTTPTQSVLNNDLVAVYPNCPCGRGDYFKIFGRAGKVKLKMCALKVDELLEKN